MLKTWCPGIFCALLLSMSGIGRAQFGGLEGFSVNAEDMQFEGGVASYEGNVQIHLEQVSIYADRAEYNAETRDILLIGNVRIYTLDNLFTAQRALYNRDSGQIRALEFSGEQFPLKFRALSLMAPSLRDFRVRDASFTVDDSSEPDFRIRAKTMRIFPDDRVSFTNSFLYIGETPVFWFPYLFAYTNNTGIELRPGYDSRWGYYLLTGYSFPIGEGGNFIGTVDADYRTELGFGIGFDSKFRFGQEDRSYGEFKSYYAYDINPDERVGGPGEPREPGDHDRYRVTFQNRTFLTDDIYATFDINKLSDIDFLEDYFPNEFRVDPQPDNFVSLTKWDEFYTLTLLTRWQMNDFFQTTERLPELALDIKQHRIFDLPIYYDGENTVGYYRRAFPDGSILPDYEATRFDTFHQISYPKTYFGWLSLIPKVGVRGTYYSRTGRTVDVLSEQQLNQVNNFRQRAMSSRSMAGQQGAQIGMLQSQLDSTVNPTQRANLQRQIEALQRSQQVQLSQAEAFEAQANAIESGDVLNGRELEYGGGTFRPIVNFGFEGSFKLSKRYETIQSRALGLDGVLHTVQPYFNYSYVYNGGLGRDRILQFDRVVPATEPLPLDFPEFVGIDSIDDWSILRLGTRHRLTTRRGDDNWEWFVIDSFIDLNFNNPYIDNDRGTVSNSVNRIEFRPVSWMSLRMDAQLPLTDDGFTDVNTSILFMPWRDLLIQFSDRYLDDNPFFQNSNQLSGYAYYQVTSHWGVSAQATYEAVEDILLLQRYMIHRDISSWIVSVGGEVRENQGGDTEYGVLFTMTLKDAPQVHLPLAFDQGTGPLGSED